MERPLMVNCGRRFEEMSGPDWLQRHTAVSEEDFAKDTSRNRFAILLSRTNHLSYHLGQLIQLKLAKMEVARLNIENLVFRVLESSQAGKPMSLSEASAMKLYAAGAATEVALEAVQLFGGNGYMAEYEVEQLARDAKVLQIYAGTDEIQVGQIARALLA